MPIKADAVVLPKGHDGSAVIGGFNRWERLVEHELIAVVIDGPFRFPTALGNPAFNVAAEGLAHAPAHLRDRTLLACLGTCRPHQRVVG